MHGVKDPVAIALWEEAEERSEREEEREDLSEEEKREREGGKIMMSSH